MSNRYEIREQIGKGGLGAVYKAFDTQLQREVAIKRVLTTGQATDEEVHEAADKLIAEAQTLSSLNHPNIITVFDVGQDDQGGFVVMELLKGETLDETVERGVLTQEDFTEVVYQTMEALIAAQANDVIHRDIKPTNIMVIWQASGKFQTKILDFGLAKFSRTPSVQTMDQEESVLGSIFFMAPEQFERGELDARTDLYQMGCVYYNALTGQYPFNGETAPQVMNSHLQHKVVPLDQIRPDLSPSICQWVMWLINRDIEHRPTDARDALKRWPRNQESTGPVPVQALPVEEILDGVTGQIRIVTTASQASAPPALIVGTSPNSPPGLATGSINRPLLHQHSKPPAHKKTKVVVIGAIAGVIALLAVIGIVNSAEVKKQQARIKEMAAAEEVYATVKDVGIAVGILSDPETPGSLRTNALEVLTKIEAPGIDEAILEELKEAKSNNLRVYLSVVLGDKSHTEALPTILSYVPSASNEDQQLQFITAAGKLADDEDLADILAVLQSNPSTAVRRSIEGIALNLLRHSSSKARYIGDILTRISAAESDERKSLFRILGALSTDEVKTRLSSIFNQKKDLEYQRDAISAYLTWGDRSAIPNVEAIINNSDDRSLKVIAGKALARLVTLPGPETLEEKIAVWDSAAGRISDQNDQRRLVGTLFEYPHPETLQLLRKWADDENLKSVAKSSVSTMEKFINQVKTINPGEALPGNRGRVLGDKKAAFDSSLGSITQWTSPNTWFSWSFKIAEVGDYTLEIEQAYDGDDAVDFIVYVANQTLTGTAVDTGNFSSFRPIKLDGKIKLEKDTIYTIVLKAGDNTAPRMMDIGAIRFIKS